MKQNWVWVVLAILVLLLVLFMFRMGGKRGDSAAAPTGWTVYGSHNCGWTTKQLAEMDSKSVDYTFVDCDQNPGQCEGISGFPTLKNDDGTVKTGFTPM